MRNTVTNQCCHIDLCTIFEFASGVMLPIMNRKTPKRAVLKYKLYAKIKDLNIPYV